MKLFSFSQATYLFFSLVLFSCSNDSLLESNNVRVEDQLESKLLCLFGNNASNPSVPATDFGTYFKLVAGKYVINNSGWDPCNVTQVCYGQNNPLDNCVPASQFSISVNQCDELRFRVTRDCGAPCSGWFLVPPSCVEPNCGSLDFSLNAFFEVTEDCGNECTCCYKRKNFIAQGTCNLATTSIETNIISWGNEAFQVNGQSRWCPSQTRCVTALYRFSDANVANGCTDQGQGKVCSKTICLPPINCFSRPPDHSGLDPVE